MHAHVFFYRYYYSNHGLLYQAPQTYWDFILIYFKIQTSETRRPTHHMLINLFTNRFECMQTAVCSKGCCFIMGRSWHLQIYIGYI